MPSTHTADDPMQAAYDRLRQPDWPSLDEITRHAMLFQVLRAAVNRRSHAAPPAVHTSAQPTAHRVPVPHHRPTFDAKSAAAGERPDDE